MSDDEAKKPPSSPPSAEPREAVIDKAIESLARDMHAQPIDSTLADRAYYLMRERSLLLRLRLKDDAA